MAGPYTFTVKKVALRYPAGEQATEDTAPSQTAVELDNNPQDINLLPGSIITLAVVGDARADFVEGQDVAVSVAAVVPGKAKASADTADRSSQYERHHGR